MSGYELSSQVPLPKGEGLVSVLHGNSGSSCELSAFASLYDTSESEDSEHLDNVLVLAYRGRTTCKQEALLSTKSVLPITQWPGFRERTPWMGGDFRSLTRKDFHGIAPMPYRPRAVVEKCPTKVGMSHGVLGWNRGHSVGKVPCRRTVSLSRRRVPKPTLIHSFSEGGKRL